MPACYCVNSRQMVARSLLDTLKAVNEDERDCITVLERVGRLADDSGKTPLLNDMCLFHI